MLFIAAVFLILRLPFSVVLAGLIPAVVILRDGLTAPKKSSLAMWVFLATGLVCSSFAWVTSGARVPLVNNATLMMVMIALAAAITLTPATVRTLRWTMNGVLAGLWICLLSAVAEVITGVKILPLIYPDANTAAAISGNRFVVASFFPNYNDFSVAMALLGIILSAQLLLGGHASPVARIGRISGLGLVCFFILVIGSRGALLSLVLGCGLVGITAMRLQNRRLITVPKMLVGALAAIGAGVFLMTTPFVLNSSTLLRGEIISRSISMLTQDAGRLVHGWASMGIFRNQAAAMYGGSLMDPHNLLLELATMYGLPTLLAFLAVWVVIAYRGFWKLHGWREVSALIISLIMPVVGVVPSSSLRYYWVYLFMALTFAAFQLESRRRAIELAVH